MQAITDNYRYITVFLHPVILTFNKICIYNINEKY